jgi:chemotaxis protein MotA
MTGKTNKKRKLDLATVGGIVLAVAGIIGGLLLEGGTVKDIAQFTAGMIVLSGTLGAVLVTTPMRNLKGAVGRLRSVIFDLETGPEELLEKVVTYAQKARRSGLVSLEDEAALEPDPFLKKALNLAVDGTDLNDLRTMMELDIDLAERRAETDAKVFEVAGGYAPTIGIIGAVMGLIQVMKHLENIDEVGRGIAVAFVATVYGVASANILFLPAAGKIKAHAHRETELKELTLEGVAGIVEGMNPKLIRAKLAAYCQEASGGKQPAKPAATDENASAFGAEA